MGTGPSFIASWVLHFVLAPVCHESIHFESDSFTSITEGADRILIISLHQARLIYKQLVRAEGYLISSCLWLKNAYQFVSSLMPSRGVGRFPVETHILMGTRASSNPELVVTLDHISSPPSCFGSIPNQFRCENKSVPSYQKNPTPRKWTMKSVPTLALYLADFIRALDIGKHNDVCDISANYRNDTRIAWIQNTFDHLPAITVDWLHLSVSPTLYLFSTQSLHGMSL